MPELEEFIFLFIIYLFITAFYCLLILTDGDNNATKSHCGTDLMSCDSAWQCHHVELQNLFISRRTGGTGDSRLCTVQHAVTTTDIGIRR